MRKSIRTPIKKTARSCHLLWRVLLLVSVSLFFAGTALAGPLQLQTSFDNNTVYSEQPAPHYLEVLVTAAPATGAVKKRLPLNLALVIDTSGSMRDENKLTSVQQAAIALVNRQTTPN
ncbi:MAG: hypothetical protein D3908_00445, partial [Candidatus Electrothrix sp. AUS4]|nr:hypothetical protein [Candidatus Electrothrix sp. AUS4]